MTWVTGTTRMIRMTKMTTMTRISVMTGMNMMNLMTDMTRLGCLLSNFVLQPHCGFSIHWGQWWSCRKTPQINEGHLQEV